jgi:four helix bundle protein
VQNKEFAAKLQDRTRVFAIRIIKLATSLPDTPEARVIRYQITKCGTSIGANYREANRSRSKAEFKSKIRICETEASETQYWLEIIKDLGWVPLERLKPELAESSELLAIFTAISKTTSL